MDWGCECWRGNDWFRFSMAVLGHNLAVAGGLQLAYNSADVDCAFRAWWTPGEGEEVPGWKH